MKKKYIAVLMLSLGIWVKAWGFNPIMPYNMLDNVYSFRALSSGFMYYGYMDYAQNPLLLTKADRNAIFTGLSNFNGSEFLFGNIGDNDIKFGGIYHGGIGSEGLIFSMRNQRSLNLNPLGTMGEATIDSTIYEDTDADGYPDIRRFEHLYSNAWDNNTDVKFGLSFYIDRDDYGFGFYFGHVQSTQKIVAGGDTLNPYGVFVYNEQVLNNANGLLIRTVNGSGDGSTVTSFNSSLGAIGANFHLGDMPVNALLLYRDEHTTLQEGYMAGVLRDNSPLDPSDAHFVQNTYERSNNDDVYFKRVSLLAVYPDSEFNVTYAVNFGVLMHSGKVGTFYNTSGRLAEDRLSDSIMVNINRNTTVTSLGEPEGTGYDGYFTMLKGLSLSDRASMRFGISLYGLKDKVQRHVITSDTVYTGFRDGDVQANDPDDFDDLVYSKVEYDSTYERVNFTVAIPCGVVYKPHKKIELRMGVLEQLAWDKTQNYTVVSGVTPRTHEVTRGDGSHTVTKSPLVFENMSIGNETLTPITNFYYGIGFNLTDALSLDIMNFANLVNLNNWQVSLVFKF